MNNVAPHILLVDDDRELLNLLSEYLVGEGFQIACAESGGQALQYLAQGTDFAALVLDVMMPNLSGLELLKQLRQTSTIPVIMLTGRGDEIDRILGLELGADDYLGKPCNPRELSARIKAVLRRTHVQPAQTDEAILSIGLLNLDRGNLVARRGNQTIPLTSTEFRTLMLLGQHAGQTLTKEFLTEQILQRKLSPFDRSMDVHISRIRHKLNQYPDLTVAIKSIRGVGYQLLQDPNHND